MMTRTLTALAAAGLTFAGVGAASAQAVITDDGYGPPVYDSAPVYAPPAVVAPPTYAAPGYTDPYDNDADEALKSR